MFGIKPFKKCIKNKKDRQSWIDIAEQKNLQNAQKYMQNRKLKFDVVDEFGSPEFWEMVLELREIAYQLENFSVESGFLPGINKFYLEIWIGRPIDDERD